jgi:hypothetical protein
MTRPPLNLTIELDEDAILWNAISLATQAAGEISMAYWLRNRLRELLVDGYLIPSEKARGRNERGQQL